WMITRARWMRESDRMLRSAEAAAVAGAVVVSQTSKDNGLGWPTCTKALIDTQKDIAALANRSSLDASRCRAARRPVWESVPVGGRPSAFAPRYKAIPQYLGDLKFSSCEIERGPFIGRVDSAQNLLGRPLDETNLPADETNLPAALWWLRGFLTHPVRIGPLGNPNRASRVDEVTKAYRSPATDP